MLNIFQSKQIYLWILLVVAFACGCAKSGPSDSRVFIEWASEHVITVGSLDSSLSGTDLEALREAIGSARVVGVGESRHDTREQLLLKSLLTRHMIEDLGFRALILEESFPHVELLDHYVTSGAGDLRNLMNRLAGWYLWDTEEMLDVPVFLIDVREAKGSEGAAKWLQQARGMRAQDARAVLVPGAAFDLVYFVNDISRSQPTPMALQRYQSLGEQR